MAVSKPLSSIAVCSAVCNIAPSTLGQEFRRGMAVKGMYLKNMKNIFFHKDLAVRAENEE